jgi:hypothetical protein
MKQELVTALVTGADGVWAADQTIDPALVATAALDGLFAGDPQILADDMSPTARAQLSDSHREP